MSKDVVGKSNRTPGKHKALDAFVGKQAGVASVLTKNKEFDGTFWIVDCTAGDGLSEDFSRSTSPGILLRHADWMKQKGVNTEVILFERSKRNAEKLSEIVGDQAKVIPTSSENMDVFWSSKDFLFVSNDPNTIGDWALPNALQQAPQMTTVFSTLGCNVGGLKRLPRVQREQWYTHLQNQARLLQSWHDMFLVALVKDQSQWAYAVNAPSKNKWKNDLDIAFRNSFDKLGYTTERIWLKENQPGFKDMVDRLFLTKKEYQDAH